VKKTRTLQDLRFAFIGAGSMGQAMIGGLLSRHHIEPDNITASDKFRDQLIVVRNRFHIHTTLENRIAARKGQVVVLAVKPQVLQEVLSDLNGQLKRDTLVISIVAGATIESLAAGLRHRTIVRTMPNTPSQIGEGMTVWTATPEVSDVQREQARTIIEALGHQLYVNKERFLDVATAVSGSGPSYTFLFMEAFVDAAVHLGFSHSDARELVVQTIKGSALFAQQSKLHFAEMRNMVTSPGGTSADALYQLEKGAFRAVLSKAVFASYQRSVALGQMNIKRQDERQPGLKPKRKTRR